MEVKENIGAFRNLPDVFYRTDTDGNIVTASPSIESILGYTPAEAVGMNIAVALYLEPNRWSIMLEMLDKNGSVKGFKTQLKRKDGSIIWVSENSQLYYDQKGNIAGVQSIFRDITGEKQAAELQQRLSTVIEQATELIIITGPDGVIQYVNPAFENTTGYTSEK